MALACNESFDVYSRCNGGLHDEGLRPEHDARTSRRIVGIVDLCQEPSPELWGGQAVIDHLGARPVTVHEVDQCHVSMGTAQEFAYDS